MKLREHGIQDRERLRLYRIRPNCDPVGKNFGSVRLNDCYAAILILGYGFFGSVMMLCIERLAQIKVNRCFTKGKYSLDL